MLVLRQAHRRIVQSSGTRVSAKLQASVRSAGPAQRKPPSLMAVHSTSTCSAGSCTLLEDGSDSVITRRSAATPALLNSFSKPYVCSCGRRPRRWRYPLRLLSLPARHCGHGDERQGRWRGAALHSFKARPPMPLCTLERGIRGAGHAESACHSERGTPMGTPTCACMWKGPGLSLEASLPVTFSYRGGGRILYSNLEKASKKSAKQKTLCHFYTWCLAASPMQRIVQNHYSHRPYLLSSGVQ